MIAAATKPAAYRHRKASPNSVRLRNEDSRDGLPVLPGTMSAQNHSAPSSRNTVRLYERTITPMSRNGNDTASMMVTVSATPLWTRSFSSSAYHSGMVRMVGMIDSRRAKKASPPSHMNGRSST